jgi:hypothetical protein
MADADGRHSGIEPATPAIDEVDRTTQLIHFALVWPEFITLAGLTLHALGGHDLWRRMFFATYACGKRQ